MSAPSGFAVRNFHFDLGDDIPRHWLGGRKSVTTFFDGLSILFPVGERFFIASVRAHDRHVTDDHLRQEVKAFCGQEGIHGREHAAYNRMLENKGYPAIALEKKVIRLLGFVTRTVPARRRLAVTAALEHFTAILGRLVLSDPRVLEGAHPAMAALWRWHAAEENEHKSVAYDVYLRAGGNYPERVVVMAVASLIFWAKVLEHQARLMKCDGTMLSPGEWAALLRFLFVEPGGMHQLIFDFFKYFKPSFHPTDLEEHELMARWKKDHDAASAYWSAA